MNENSGMHDLQHYNREELENLVGNNEKQINFLHNTFILDFEKFLNNIRIAVKNTDKTTFIANALQIEEASKSVCYEKLTLMSINLQNIEITDSQNIKDMIEELENEVEIIKEIVGIV